MYMLSENTRVAYTNMKVLIFILNVMTDTGTSFEGFNWDGNEINLTRH